MRFIKKSITLLFFPIFLCSNQIEEGFSDRLNYENTTLKNSDLPSFKLKDRRIQDLTFSQNGPLETSFLDRLPNNLFLYLRTGGFGIFSLDAPIGGPSIGLGARYRLGHFGCSASVNASTFIILPFFSVKGEFLCYLSHIDDSYFTGVSVEAGQLFVPGFFGEPGSWQTLYQPEILLGRQYKTSTGKTTFVNIGLTPPLYIDNTWSKPVISFTYGIGF